VAVLRIEAVQTSSGGRTECQLANANREQARWPRPALNGANQPFVEDMRIPALKLWTRLPDAHTAVHHLFHRRRKATQA